MVYSSLFEIRMMSSVSPSYIKALSNQQVMDGFRNEEAKASAQFYWDFRICLRASRKITFFESQSHQLELVHKNDSMTEIKLSLL